MSGDGGKIAIIDYHLGNLFSVQRACEHVGLTARVTSDLSDIQDADGIILPGVGAFGDAINNLRELDLIEPLKDLLAEGKPFMGICLGFQLLMTESEEFGRHKGLGLCQGRVVRFPAQRGPERVKVPYIGWNHVHRVPGRTWEGSLLDGLDEAERMYFVHSYYVVPAREDTILSVSEYEGFRYCSSISSGNVFACQFHPERSAEKGLQVYRSFAGRVYRKKTGGLRDHDGSEQQKGEGQMFSGEAVEGTRR